MMLDAAKCHKGYIGNESLDLGEASLEDNNVRCKWTHGSKNPGKHRDYLFIIAAPADMEDASASFDRGLFFSIAQSQIWYIVCTGTPVQGHRHSCRVGALPNYVMWGFAASVVTVFCNFCKRTVY